MYRRPKFLEELLEIREQMSRDSYYDVDLFAERVRTGNFKPRKKTRTNQSQTKVTKVSKIKRKSL